MVDLLLTSDAFSALSNTILSAGKSIRFRAAGCSMHPLVRDGDLLTIQPVNPAEVRVGDVLLFKCSQGQTLVHRVIRIQRTPSRRTFLMQGDRALKPDGIIPQAQVLGRLTEITRAGRSITMKAPIMRLLGWLAVLHSRGLSRNAWSFRIARKVLRSMPALMQYIG